MGLKQEFNVIIQFKRFFPLELYPTISKLKYDVGCEAWSLTLREECRLRIFENRQIFVPSEGENGEWRRVHDEELHSLYRSSNTRIVNVIESRRLRWAGHVAIMEEFRGISKF